MALMQTRLRKRTSGQTGLARCALAWCAGGRFGDLARRSLRQQSENQLSVYPTSRQVALFGRQVTELEQRLKAFEQKFDLPTQPVEFEYGFSRVLIGQAGQQHNKAGGLQRARIDLLAGFDGAGHHLLARGFRLVGRQTANDQTQRQERPIRIMRINQNLMVGDIPLERGQCCEQIEQLAFGREQAKRVPSGADNQMGATVEDRSKVTRSCITAISNANFAKLPREPAQPLGTFVVRQFEVIDPARQIVARVQPPGCTVCPRFTDGARINQAQPPPCPVPSNLRTGFLQKLSGDKPKPIGRLAQAMIQRRSREFGNAARLCPGTAPAQRISASIVQSKSQQIVRAPHPTCAQEGLELACRFLNWQQLADPGQNRRPGTNPQRIPHAWKGSHGMDDLKLTHMTPALSPKGRGSPPSLSAGRQFITQRLEEYDLDAREPREEYRNRQNRGVGAEHGENTCTSISSQPWRSRPLRWRPCPHTLSGKATSTRTWASPSW